MDKIDDSIYNTVRHFILDTFVFDPDSRARVSDDLPLIDEGILDSFGVHEVLLYLESEFAITVEDEEMLSSNFGSIDAITTFVQHKIQSR